MNEQTAKKGGRPRVSPGESTTQIGVTVEQSLSDFLEEEVRLKRITNVPTLVRQILRGYKRFRMKTCSNGQSTAS